MVWWGERTPGSHVTDRDRLILQALVRFEGGICECGHHQSESLDPLHDPGNPEHVATYQAGSPYRCLACTESARAQRAYAKAYGEDHMAGTKWVTELVPRGKVLLS